MIDPVALDFPPLNCSRESRLGNYYQDLSAAIAMVEGGYHGGIDKRGVPLLSVSGQGEFANAVTTAQYALANMTAVHRGNSARRDIAVAQLDWLVDNQETDGAWAGCWLMRHHNHKYRWLQAPWTGSLASGNALSALLRGAEMFADARYSSAAESAYDGLHAPRGSWTLFVEREDDLWYEEYPASRPLHVLNGHVYTLLAILDYARARDDAAAWARWERGVTTALKHLKEFDTGYWSIYDLRFREPANVHYHKNIHIPQLRILAQLTGMSEFTEVADRWERYLHSKVSRGRLAVSLRVRARLKR
jgi:heparosan-N-sulfate-glucuronate 5-epimerase